jgi:sarcosine oxidase
MPRELFAMSEPHIAVIGLGATGSAALYQLARRGIQTTGIEQFDIGHDRGSSHGPTRIFRLAHFENTSYVPLLRRAFTLWRELETTAGQHLLSLTGIVEIGSPDGVLVKGTLAAARRYDLPHEVLDAPALTRRCPAYRLPRNFIVVWQANGGIIEAERAIKTEIRLAQDAGAFVRTREKVLAIEPSSQSVRIVTDRAAFNADGAIVAAGPWLNALVPNLHLPLRITRQVVGWFEPNDAAQFSPERFPVFLLESDHGIHYGFPTYGATGVKVSKHHHAEETIEPDSCERRVTREDEALIRAPLAQYLPDANGRLLDAQTCLYTMTPDDTFIVDRMPGFPQVVIASPCCGHGFKFSPVIGEIVADLITDGTPANDIAPFRLQRFAEIASE